jgi:hypothetical protein
MAATTRLSARFPAVFRGPARSIPSASAAPRAAVKRWVSSSAEVGRALGILSNFNSVADVEDAAVAAGAVSLIGKGPEGTGVRPIAVVKVGGEVLSNDMPNLIASIRTLRDVGLSPVVIHGGGPQLNDELAKAGVKPEYIGGELVGRDHGFVVWHAGMWIVLCRTSCDDSLNDGGGKASV